MRVKYREKKKKGPKNSPLLGMRAKRRVRRKEPEAKIKNKQNNLGSCFKWSSHLPIPVLKNVFKPGLPGDAGH